MKKLTLVLAFALSGAVLAEQSVKIPPVKLFGVGMKSPSKVVRGASTVTGASSLTVARQGVRIANDGSAQIDIVFILPSGQQLVTRQLSVAPGCGAVTDWSGNVIAAAPPAKVCALIAADIGTNFDALIGAAAAGGKLNL